MSSISPLVHLANWLPLSGAAGLRLLGSTCPALLDYDPQYMLVSVTSHCCEIGKRPASCAYQMQSVDMYIEDVEKILELATR